jgi:beta-lactamase regulating signal transducer with metallopeptidase domain
VDALSTAVFSHILTASIQLIVAAIVIEVIHRFVRGVSSSFRYWMWALLVFRFVLPVKYSIPAPDLRFFHPVIHPVQAIQESTIFSQTVSTVSLDATILSMSKVVVLLWISVIAVLCLYLCIRTMYSIRRLRSCPSCRRRDLTESLNVLRREFEISSPIELYTFDESFKTLSGPTTAWMGKLNIYLPETIAYSWDIDDIRPILIHELVHVKRKDILVNWFQIVFQIVFFFHPISWMVNRKINRMREEICDDITIRSLDDKRKKYSTSIIKVLETIEARPSYDTVAFSFSERTDSLAQRIIRLTDPQYTLYRPMGRKSYVGLALITMLVCVVSCDYQGDSILGASPREMEPSESVIMETTDAEEDQSYITITVHDKNTYSIHGNTFGISELYEELRGELKNTRDKDLLIDCVHEVDMDVVYDIFKVGQDVGYTHIAIHNNGEIL